MTDTNNIAYGQTLWRASIATSYRCRTEVRLPVRGVNDIGGDTAEDIIFG